MPDAQHFFVVAEKDNNPFSLWMDPFFQARSRYRCYLCGVICFEPNGLWFMLFSAYLQGICYKRYHEGTDPKTRPSIQQLTNQPTNQPTSFKLNPTTKWLTTGIAIEAKLDFNSTYWVGTLPRFIVVNAGLVQDPLLKMHLVVTIARKGTP